MNNRMNRLSKGDDRPEEKKEKERRSLFKRTKIGGGAVRLTQSNTRLSIPPSLSGASSNTNRDSSSNSLSTDTSLNDSNSNISSRLIHMRKSTDNLSLDTVLETNISDDVNHPVGTVTLNGSIRSSRSSDVFQGTISSVKRSEINQTPLSRKIRVEDTPRLTPSLSILKSPNVDRTSEVLGTSLLDSKIQVWIQDTNTETKNPVDSDLKSKHINDGSIITHSRIEIENIEPKVKDPEPENNEQDQEMNDDSTSGFSQPSIYHPITSMNSSTREEDPVKDSNQMNIDKPKDSSPSQSEQQLDYSNLQPSSRLNLVNPTLPSNTQSVLVSSTNVVPETIVASTNTNTNNTVTSLSVSTMNNTKTQSTNPNSILGNTYLNTMNMMPNYQNNNAFHTPVASHMATNTNGVLNSSISTIPGKNTIGLNNTPLVQSSQSPDLFYNLNSMNVNTAIYPALLPSLLKNQNSHLKPIVVFKSINSLYLGGSSSVFSVLDENNDIYALKYVHLGNLPKIQLEGYLNEVQLLQRLKGRPGIINLIDSYIDKKKKRLFIIMEQGDIDLAKYLEKRKQNRSNSPVDSIYNMNFLRLIWHQMLIAVNTIHKEHIIHSDLKPANFIFVQGTLKLIDFGISRAFNSDQTSVIKDKNMGTLNYISPEALRNESEGQLRCSSDVWSLGCILYEIVYGHPPYSDLKLGPKIRAIVDTELNITFPEASDYEDNQLLRDVLCSCLCKDPSKRPSIDGSNGLLRHPFLYPHGSDASFVYGSSILAKDVLPNIIEQTLKHAEDSRLKDKSVLKVLSSKITYRLAKRLPIDFDSLLEFDDNYTK